MNFLDTSDVQKKLSVVSKLIVVCELRIDDVTRMSWHAVLTILLLIFFSFFFLDSNVNAFLLYLFQDN